MSTLRTNQILSTAGKPILNSSGSVVQTIYTRSDTRNTYASGVSGDGTTITDLNISITPTNSNNRLICQWMINCETNVNTVTLIHRDGALITTVGEEGRNNISNNRWVGYNNFVPSTGVSDNNSTMVNNFLMYSQIAGSTASRTYAPAVRGSGATAYTFALNRTLGSIGADNFENTVSTGIIYEVVV